MQLILIVFKNGVSANLKKNFCSTSLILTNRRLKYSKTHKKKKNKKNTFCLSPHRLTQKAQYQNWIANTNQTSWKRTQTASIVLLKENCKAADSR